MMEPGYTFRYFEAPPIVEPNRVTGVGRGKFRPLRRKKIGDQKKRQRRKIAKKSKRLNRR